MGQRKPFHVMLDEREREILATISANQKCSEGEAARRCIRAIGKDVHVPSLAPSPKAPRNDNAQR